MYTKYFLISTILFLTFLTGNAQNLVLNPGFERSERKSNGFREADNWKRLGFLSRIHSSDDPSYKASDTTWKGYVKYTPLTGKGMAICQIWPRRNPNGSGGYVQVKLKNTSPKGRSICSSFPCVYSQQFWELQRPACF